VDSKFSSDVFRVEMQAEVNQEVVRVQRLQAELTHFQDLLDTVERGVKNLYFRMSCVFVEVWTNTLAAIVLV